MVQIEGKYQHERSENLDGFFKAVGVPYVARVMMRMTSPLLEVLRDAGKWVVRSTTMVRTQEMSFVPGVEYDEVMPSGDVLKNTAQVEDDCISIVSLLPNGKKTTREYKFSDESVEVTLTDEESGQVAKRYFRRV
ncbi:sodium/calcium exchanger regulatory protein 1-like isoform X1 [Bacillus rossius redtenbacheri]|uniref:sodium/calcium exchanger regulatory protein 1-like isoform X1 n=1 Tax=Bacillus rossius redtenbacheri TaxID=93214 RepID=UPI002FDD6AB8